MMGGSANCARAYPARAVLSSGTGTAGTQHSEPKCLVLKELRSKPFMPDLLYLPMVRKIGHLMPYAYGELIQIDASRQGMPLPDRTGPRCPSRSLLPSSPMPAMRRGSMRQTRPQQLDQGSGNESGSRQ